MTDKLPATPEHFVPAETVAEFLSVPPRRVKELARTGKIPAYPLGAGLRRIWRFRLSEIAAAMSKQPARPSVEFTAGTQNRSTKG